MSAAPKNSVTDAAAASVADDRARRLCGGRTGTRPHGEAMNGDDLSRARLFCLAATSEMDAIIQADRLQGGDRRPQGRDPVWICERLDTIQRHAKRARARAIYRSAQDALSLIERSNAHFPIDWTRVDGRLFVLNKLLGQYATGLDEIALDKDTDKNVGETYGPEAPALSHHASDDSQAAISKATLTTLLPHAAPEERAALKRLMDIDLSVSAREDTDFPSEPATAAPDTADSEPIDFMLPALMQRLLGVGQQYGKVLSLSHALDDVWITKAQRGEIESSLFDRLSELIAGSLPLQGVGRLDIGASTQGPIKGLEISGSGFDTFTLLLPDGALATPCALSDVTDRETPAPPPMITDETEGDLRAQLAALMDSGLEGQPT